jgi:UDP-N-acetylglucosamine 2-epimerase (non-hydrolysing)
MTMNKIKVMFVFGTRPEAIKMAPLVKVFSEMPEIFESKVLVTAQHREMLDQVLEIFEIKPDYDLNIMKHHQTLPGITSNVLEGVGKILEKEHPDILLVHGDTTTTFSAALAAFYNKVKVAHVEAGLRSYNKWSPFPEEMNRSLTGRIADWHFAPTQGNRENLLNEGIADEKIFVTGNTVIDALKSVIEEDYIFDQPLLDGLRESGKRIVLLTAHRRENFGAPMQAIFEAVKEVSECFDDVVFIYPMHLNPVVRKPAMEILGDCSRVLLIEPLGYVPFANLMAISHLVLTDSGGIQEEAPALGKPVLVLRRETERPEAVDAGTVRIIGTERQAIVQETKRLLEDQVAYAEMANAVNPYGDGQTSKRIAEIIMHMK